MAVQVCQYRQRVQYLKRSNVVAVMPAPVTHKCTPWEHFCGTVASNKNNSICQQSQAGELRLQAFGVTEPGSGTDTTRIQTRARREGDHYVINGQKVFISRTEHSDLMILLVRTTAREDCTKPTDGMSVLLVDMREALDNGMTIKPIKTMMNHSCTELFFDDLKVPVENLIGEEGRGFSYIVDGMNAERILIAAECIGDARFFVDQASSYAKQREVFGRPIGLNQGIQFPIARAHIQTEAADAIVKRAAQLFEQDRPCGSDANMAKLLASEASWFAADTCVQTFGGFGFASEYNIERKFPRNAFVSSRSNIDQFDSFSCCNPRHWSSKIVLETRPQFT